jgi:hypothetical protein
MVYQADVWIAMVMQRVKVNSRINATVAWTLKQQLRTLRILLHLVVLVSYQFQLSLQIVEDPYLMALMHLLDVRVK